jgi:hypothetical protein
VVRVYHNIAEECAAFSFNLLNLVMGGREVLVLYEFEGILAHQGYGRGNRGAKS